MRRHQGKCSPRALLKLCSVLPYFYIFHPFTSTQSLFLSSVSQIIAFLPKYFSSSSQPLCEGFSDLGVLASPREETWLGECLPAGTKGSIRKGTLHTVLDPGLSSSQLFPGDPFPALSPSLPSQRCSRLLWQSHLSLETDFLRTKPKSFTHYPNAKSDQ